MKVFWIFVGAITAATGLAANITACGGKLASDDGTTGNSALDHSRSASSPSTSSTYPPCPTDTSPPPTPPNVAPELENVCASWCSMETTCAYHCTDTLGVCVANCVNDVTNAQCGDVSVDFYRCQTEQQPANNCEPPPKCFASYCKYFACTTAGTGATAPGYCQ
jgi:hypothetical protein